MPQNVRYIAQESLISGHVAGAAYYLNLRVTRKDRSRHVSRNRQVFLNGNVATTYNSGSEMWKVQTAPLPLAEALQMREFLDSVEDGQRFLFDPIEAVGASPSYYRTVVMESTIYSEVRKDRGGDQTGDLFSFTFEMRVVP